MSDAAPLHKLTALRGRPNRQIPIGGKVRHVRTGSTILLSADEAAELEAYLEDNGIAGDYRVELCRPKVRTHTTSAKPEAKASSSSRKRK